MATLVESKLERRPPFLNRSYGGFTAEQESFYLPFVQDGAVVLDPMAGQGYLLGQLAQRGHHVWLGDVNPALLMLASLRDPQLVTLRDEVTDWARTQITKLPDIEFDPGQADFVDDWVSPTTKEQLLKYRDFLGLDGDNPYCFDSNVWRAAPELRFAAALPVLAARRLSCFRVSDNVTWLKRGGLERQVQLKPILIEFVNLWHVYACQVAEAANFVSSYESRLHVRPIDAGAGRLADMPEVDCIVTSPPYANRLDYSRMWAPELEVLCAMMGVSSQAVKTSQIGSVVVSGQRPDLNNDDNLPSVILSALQDIRDDGDHHASRVYYYPFFRNYARSLADALRVSANKLRLGGRIVVYVRDTVRKDVLFPTGELVKSILVGELGLREVGRHRLLIRQHVGLKRRNSSAGFYGLTQQEWWLAFER